MLGCLSQIAAMLCAVLAGLGYFSLWWCLVPIFLTSSLAISDGPQFDRVVAANREGRLSVFPTMLALGMLPWLAICSVAYWATAKAFGAG